MTRPFAKQKLVIATHNPGKLREFQTLLGSFVKEITSAGELGLPEPIEDGTTFEENAKIKALAAAKASGLVALADDSGLCVTALNNAPGIFSARWTGPEKDVDGAMNRINTELGNATDRSAHFACALCLAWPDGHTEAVTGRTDGTIVWPGRGIAGRGHGYDPIFQPETLTKTFAEITQEEKNALSHRGRALRELVEKFFT